MTSAANCTIAIKITVPRKRATRASLCASSAAIASASSRLVGRLSIVLRSRSASDGWPLSDGNISVPPRSCV